MAPSGATPLSQSQKFTIDLTQSDDEYEPATRLSRKRTSAAVHLSWEQAGSHDGLPVSVDSAPGQELSIGELSKTRNIFRYSVGDRTRQISSSAHAISQLPTTVNNSHSISSFAQTPTTRTDFSCTDTTYGANISKRRKTTGASISQGLLIPKMPSSGLLVSGRPDSMIEKIQEPTSQIVSSLTPSFYKDLEASARYPVKSGISHNSQIQETKRRSNHNLRFPAEEREERMVQVLRNQVFKHIKLAIRPYERSLKSIDRREIGTQTARRLVEDSSFAENFTANHWELSPGYEKQLAKRAQAYVDKYVKQVQDEAGDRSFKIYNGMSKYKPTSFANTEPKLGKSSPSDGRVRSSPVSSDVDSRSYHHLTQNQTTNPRSKLFKTRSTHDNSLQRQLRTLSDAVSDEGVHEDGTSRRSTRSSITSQSRADSLEPQMNSLRHVQKSSAQQVISSGSLEIAKSKLKLRIHIHGYIRELPRHYLRQLDIDKTTQAPKSAYVRITYLQSRLGLDTHAEGGYIVHVAFCRAEVEYVCQWVTKILSGKHHASDGPDTRLMSIMAGQNAIVPRLVELLEQELARSGSEPGRRLLQARGSAALSSFLLDASEGCIVMGPQLVHFQAQKQQQITVLPRMSIASLLREREVLGMAPSRVRRGQSSFCFKASSRLEGSLVRQHEWIDSCGDISAVTWTSDKAFLCGATAHSDHHNMQYNKPGNLLVGSSTQATLKAFADHRVPRPICNNTTTSVNAPDSMYQTHDPWLYTSVVAVSHSETTGFTFTASFDKTVKVWMVAKDGASMDLCGTWIHDGQVNLVVTSERHERVATASTVSANAIRVYNFDENDISSTPFDTYCGEKAKEQALELRRKDKWAYHPATIQWGRAEGVKNLLLVGYSPRSVTGHEMDIPEDKQNSGELCLWNTNDGSRISISSAKTQNVFEVIWHPSQPCFLAATSPCGVFETETKTQVRLFAQNEFGTFIHLRTMDCPAADINELTMMPNSNVQCYVTASCTDGNTYVWDTSQGDKPIHVLSHAESLDNPLHDLPLELADSGVKFASWGRTVDLFYTGGSDGKVKAWNIRAGRGKAFVRNVLEVSGGISTGAFSKDFSHLLIGDATGKVHLLGVDDSDSEESITNEPLKMLGTIPPDIYAQKRLAGKRPKLIIPHSEPTAQEGFGIPNEEAEQTGQEAGKRFLDSKQLQIHPDRKIGVTQGPYYHETGLYRDEAHFDNDGTQPLLPEWQSRQQFERKVPLQQEDLPYLGKTLPSTSDQHNQNMSLDFDLEKLTLSCRYTLIKDRVELNWNDYDFAFELGRKMKSYSESGSEFDERQG